LNFTFDGIKAASRSIERLRDFSHRLETTSTKEEDGYALEDETKKMLVLFQKAIADDLNISAALAALFDWIVDMNRLLDQAGVGVQALRRAKEALHRVDQILGVIYCDKKEEIPAQITHWFEERQLARKNKNWPLSDQLRDQILKAGFIIEDGLQGQARLKAVSDK
jgi:cysteinyl-tRNA synthetase